MGKHRGVGTLMRLLGGLLLALLAGCTTLTDRGPWGATVSWPSGQRLGQSAMDALRHPQTWVPLAGAAVIGVTDLDDDISEWAAGHQPLFGSNAEDVSDDLRTFNTFAYVATALIAPSDSISSRVKGLAVGAATLTIEEASVQGIKSLTGRERPDGSDDRSFPSGHTSRASVSSALAAENLNYMHMPDWTRRTLQIGLYTTAAATGWARVEAERHYPSDVLAGYAVGQFLARFMQGAFFEASPAAGPAAIQLRPLPGGAELTMRVALGAR